MWTAFLVTALTSIFIVPCSGPDIGISFPLFPFPPFSLLSLAAPWANRPAPCTDRGQDSPLFWAVAPTFKRTRAVFFSPPLPVPPSPSPPFAGAGSYFWQKDSPGRKDGGHFPILFPFLRSPPHRPVPLRKRTPSVAVGGRPPERRRRKRAGGFSRSYSIFPFPFSASPFSFKGEWPWGQRAFFLRLKFGTDGFYFPPLLFLSLVSF